MRMMCLRLLKGIRSGHTSVDTMGALVTPLFTLCTPGVALERTGLGMGLGLVTLDLATAYGPRVSASISNVARMHAMLVL